MEKQGWVRAWQMGEDGTFPKGPTDEERRRNANAYREWLPTADLSDLALDEVGLWYEITSDGRAEWERWTGREIRDRRHSWVLEYLDETRSVVVYPDSIASADEAYSLWLQTHPGIELVDNSRCVEPISSFRMKDGTAVPNGVKVVYKTRTVS